MEDIIKEEDVQLEPIKEPTIIFRTISDRSVMTIASAETEKTLVQISGYDLQIDFNMEYINSMQDVEAAVKGLGDLFRDIILDKLFKDKSQQAE